MTRKKVLMLLGSVCLALVLVVPLAGGCAAPTPTPTPTPVKPTPTPSPTPPEKVRFNFVSYHPLKHPSTEASQRFADELKERSNGRIVCEYYPAETLVKGKEIFDAVSAGRIQMGECDSAYFAGSIPVVQVLALPGAVKTWQSLRDAMDKGLQDVYQREYDKFDLVMLHHVAIPTYLIINNVRPVLSPEDVKGLKLKVSGKVFGDIAEALGASPVMLSGPELYMALQRGTVDGAFWLAYCQLSYKTIEVTKYALKNVPCGRTSISFFVNKDWWQGLPDDVRNLILDTSDIFYEAGEGFVQMDEEAWTAMEEKPGFVISEASPEQVKAFADKVTPLIERCLDEYGPPSHEIYDLLEELQ